jgi:hypothetical protein
MNNSPYRSLFWPIVLIGVGLVWFLVNINIIPAINALALLNLWPLLLIALGLDLIFGRRSPVIGLLIGIGTLGVAVAILLAAPNLVPTGQYVTEMFKEPLGAATSASVRIDGASQPVTIRALNDSDLLFDASIGHTGSMDFQVSGTAERQIRLSHRGGINQPFSFTIPAMLKWDIGLNPKVPVALTYNGASGSSDLNLGGLQLTSLDVDGGSGSLHLALPAAAKPYAAVYKGGSGSLRMDLPADTDLNVRLSGGSGSLSLQLPGNAPVRIEVKDNDSGSFSAPGWTTRLSGKSSEDQGVWESANYSSAAHKLSITVENLGSGSISIH